jgi:hypothetical protein
MTNQKATFEGWGYRTSSRFASWTDIVVKEGMVSVTGPRVGVLPYRLWLAAQVILLVLIVPALVAALVFWDWRYLVLAVALLAAHWFVGVMGAAGLWELANTMAIGPGHPTHSFPVGAVKRVKIGAGWARNGLWLVILPYVPGINKMAEGHCVSFEAPAGDTSGDAVYAFHMHAEDDAQALARLLEGK